MYVQFTHGNKIRLCATFRFYRYYLVRTWCVLGRSLKAAGKWKKGRDGRSEIESL